MASDSGITSIVLRSSRKLSYESVLAVLDELFPDAYDFLYLPWPKLAIVNFTTPELCRLAWGILDNSRHGDVDIRYVKEAHHQGLAQNLALFCAKEGWENKEAGAPKVFVSGREISIDEAMEQFVSVEMLQNFQAGGRFVRTRKSSCTLPERRNTSWNPEIDEFVLSCGMRH
ncbi:unnamed protein product [Durusdinium trenchii]|uniref:Uncharacterized protein n=1 Tax=Durusdinium trenchii TaxID=1381693 RepID=A0ABP0KBK2_9DINO